MSVLSATDAARAERVHHKLARHGLGDLALTGGFAYQLHSHLLGLECSERALNDLDFITGGFGCIPDTLSQDFLFRHIHPFASRGKTMLQLIDPAAALRIDIFRACGETMSRAIRVDLPFGPLQVVSLEDLVARAGRLLLDLAEGVPVASKHARDYLRFVRLASPIKMEAAWQDHKKPLHPAKFRETNGLLQLLIPRSGRLLITPQYSQDPNQPCPQCELTGGFQLADPKVVLSLLGYS